MRKAKELGSPRSYLIMANDNEPLFVLRGTDVTTPAVIAFWCEQRIRAGKNDANDEQIKEAMQLAYDAADYFQAQKEA